MCTNCRYIYNHYSRRSVLVKCGKCPACLQEKACMRSNRIRNNVAVGQIQLFITLTYTNDYVPYIKRSELMSDSLDVNVYRNADVRWIYSKYNGYSLKKESGTHIIDSVYIPIENRSDGDVLPLKSLNGLGKDNIGVCLVSDFQKFIKRLKQHLSRVYNYEKKFSYFYCTEYGGYSHRPHIHALLFIGQNDEAVFRHSILACWSYADKRRTEKYIEVARDAASYCSSYVNSNLGLSSPLQISKFKSSHNYSHGFGTNLDCFSLDSILSKVDSGNLFYYRQQKFDGVTSTIAVPIPSYVINRYFPLHKGFSRLDVVTLESILLSPDKCGYILQDYCIGIDNPLYHFSPSESYRIYVNLENCYAYFHAKTGLNRYDYKYYFMRVWDLHRSISLRLSYERIECYDDFSDFYENANDLVNGVVHSPTLDKLTPKLQVNPNLRADLLESTRKFMDLYAKLDKQKKVTNYVMVQNRHYV